MALRWRFAMVPLLIAVAAAGCGSSTRTKSGVLQVVAAENVWGSIAAQIGGTKARVTSIITNPGTDPHAYEPTPADARALSSADMVIVNGVGYDPWATKLVSANAGRAVVLNVGTVTHVPNGGNPHRWYNPTDVATVIAQMVDDFSRADPADAGYFSAQKSWFETVALKDYNGEIADIRARYAGTPVGASESIFSMLAPALGLDVLTPDTFLRAISQGNDVAAADKAIIDDQIMRHLIKIYVYNSQNATPDIAVQLDECRSAGIPTATITETLVPPTATYQDWQLSQLQRIQAALAQATGK